MILELPVFFKLRNLLIFVYSKVWSLSLNNSRLKALAQCPVKMNYICIISQRCQTEKRHNKNREKHRTDFIGKKIHSNKAVTYQPKRRVASIRKLSPEQPGIFTVRNYLLFLRRMLRKRRKGFSCFFFFVSWSTFLH